MGTMPTLVADPTVCEVDECTSPLAFWVKVDRFTADGLFRSQIELLLCLAHTRATIDTSLPTLGWDDEVQIRPIK